MDNNRIFLDHFNSLAKWSKIEWSTRSVHSPIYRKCQISTKLSSVAMSRFRSLLFLSMADRRPLSIQESTYFVESNSFRGGHNSMKKIMIQKITQNNWNFWTVNLIMPAKKFVIQSSDFPVRRTGSYHHKKSTEYT